MLLNDIKPKFNEEIVKTLAAKRDLFIQHKEPLLRTWVQNDLQADGISKKGLKWSYEQHSIGHDEINRDGKKYKIDKKATYEDLYGKYRYNKSGIPTKVKDYVNDVSTRDLVASVKSFTSDADTNSFYTMLLQEGIVCAEDAKEVKKKIVRDLLVKGNAFLKVEAYDTKKKVKRWKGKKEGEYNFESAGTELPKKRGAFVDAIDPEMVFPQPHTCNPTEYFIAECYSYGELIEAFPDIEEYVKKDVVRTGNDNPETTKDQSKIINPSAPFNHNMADKIKRMYENYTAGQNAQGIDMSQGWATGQSWFDVAVCGANDNTATGGLSGGTSLSYSNFMPNQHEFWVWKYYNTAYSPNDKESGDYCAVFIDNCLLYQGPILEADKQEPVVHIKLHETDGYWSHSMVDELKDIQDQLNDFENISRINMEHLSSTNLVTTSTFKDNTLIINPFEIGVHKIDVDTDPTNVMTSNGTFDVKALLQRLELGSVNAVNLAEGQIQKLLLEMDRLYPNVLSKVQMQPEETQELTSYSPVLAVDDIIETVGRAMSRAGEKYIKETAHSVRYMLGKNKLINLLRAYNVIVVDNEDEKIKAVADNIRLVELTKFQQEVESAQAEIEKAAGTEQAKTPEGQQQLAQAQQQIPAVPEALKKPIKTVEDAEAFLEQSKVKKDGRVYFVYDNLAAIGDDDLQVTINFSQTKEEWTRGMTGFLALAKQMGVILEPSEMATELISMYGYNKNILPQKQLSAVEQSIITSGQFRLNGFAYFNEGQVQDLGQILLGLPEDASQLEDSDYAFQKIVREKAVETKMLIAVEEAKAKAKAEAEEAVRQSKKERFREENQKVKEEEQLQNDQQIQAQNRPQLEDSAAGIDNGGEPRTQPGQTPRPAMGRPSAGTFNLQGTNL